MTNAQTAPRDFGFTEDEEMLRDLARKMLSERLPTDSLRKLVGEKPEPVYDDGQRAPWNEELWAEIVDLGWTGLAISEEDGGSGIPLVGIAGMIEEVGRHALPSPLIPTLAASLVLNAARSQVARKWMGRIAEGASATLAITDERGNWEPGATSVAARRDGDELVLQGTARFVQDAFKAELFVVSVKLGEELVLCALPKDAPGLSLEADHIHDLTRDQASLHLDEVRVKSEDLVSEDGLAALEAAWPSLLVLVSADLCGASEWLLQTTVEYATQRVQFDRPIGFFQAVKHPLVNVMIDVDRARSLLYHACAEVDAGSSDALSAARMAKSAASDAAAFASDRAIQLHGGIGFTWEYALHIYFKRNLHNQALFGDGSYQRRELANALIGPINQPRN